MNSMHGLTTENLLRALPSALQKDESMAALAASVAQALSARPSEIRSLMIYPRIEELPGDLLDILAYDFKVDWWDGDYTLSEKRKTLKDSWRVHRMLGTKAAVETAISAIYPEAQVSEWFEYGGNPYYFRIKIDVTNEDVNSDRYRRVIERINFYKNLRSHLEKIIYIVNAEGKCTAYASSAASGGFLKISVPVKTDDRVGPPKRAFPVYVGKNVFGTYLKLTTGGNFVELE